MCSVTFNVVKGAYIILQVNLRPSLTVMAAVFLFLLAAEFVSIVT